MSKYGSGISMKDFQLLEMKEVRQILNKYSMTKKDREVVEGALKQAYYEWCESNASACMVEEALMQLLDEETYDKLTKIILMFHLSGMDDKMEQTYAFYGEK